MQNLCMPMFMGSLYYVLMESAVAFSPGFSRILQTILKSEHIHCVSFQILTIYGRILLACIKYLGRCPCPRCLIEKCRIPAMGITADCQRRSHTRQDDNWLRVMIATVRGWIFEKGIGVAGAAVGRVFDLKSLLPTQVRAHSLKVKLIKIDL